MTVNLGLISLPSSYVFKGMFKVVDDKPFSVSGDIAIKSMKTVI